MTALMERAVRAVERLPAAEQDLMAEWLLAEAAAEDAFDRTIAATVPKLQSLAEAALAELHAGTTLPLDPDRL